jgi:hypothetical protein
MSKNQPKDKKRPMKELLPPADYLLFRLRSFAMRLKIATFERVSGLWREAGSQLSCSVTNKAYRKS